MARSFTIAQLIDRAKKRCELENDELLSDAEWQENLSSVYGEFYSLIAESGMRYFESEETIVSDGTADYALPAAHLATIGVDYRVTSAGQRRALCELMAQERNAYSWETSGHEAYAYALVGSNLILYPTPPSGQTYYHVYIPQPTDISSVSTSTSIDVITPDGEQFLVWALALLAKEKSEDDVRGALAERERARERVVQWATMRSFNTPRRPQSLDAPTGPRYPGDWWPRGGGDW